MYHDYNDKFTEYNRGGNIDNIYAFFDEMHDRRIYTPHPMHTHLLFDLLTHAIPMRFYGDGVSTIGVGTAWPKPVDSIILSFCLVTIWHYMVDALYHCIYLWIVYVCERKCFPLEDTCRRHIVRLLYWAYQGTWVDNGSDNVFYTDFANMAKANHPLMDVLFGTLGVGARR